MDEGQVSAPHPSLVPGFMPDENAIGPGQSNYQIAGKTRQTVCVINVGTRGSTSVTSGPSCARVRSLYQKPSISSMSGRHGGTN